MKNIENIPDDVVEQLEDAHGECLDDDCPVKAAIASGDKAACWDWLKEHQ